MQEEHRDDTNSEEEEEEEEEEDSLFYYEADDPANSSTVLLTYDGQLQETGCRNPRRFQTIDEWILRMRGEGKFIIPMRREFQLSCGSIFTGDVQYHNPTRPVENRTLMWHLGQWIQEEPTCSSVDFTQWMVACPPGGYFTFSGRELSVVDMFEEYNAMYKRMITRKDYFYRKETACCFASFLLDNVGELVPVICQRSDMVDDIHAFITDAKSVFNNDVLRNVLNIYQAAAVISE